MAKLNLAPAWCLEDRFVTPEKVFLNRRQVLQRLGCAGAGLLATSLAGCGRPETERAGGDPSKYPARRHPEFNPGWTLTHEKIAAHYNNFYEFSSSKDITPRLTASFVTAPWPIEVTGLIEKPMTRDVTELIDLLGLEERVYRFRCVEAWAMIVPWTGFALSKLIEHVSPRPSATFLRFETFDRPDQAPSMTRAGSYPWPYTEGLRLDEARHPLTFIATGIYGKPLPKQHGAPARLVVPWKYGYKSIKSIVKIEFIDRQPATFWETLAPDEYPFESNVNPKVPHPRWSQAFERRIDTGDRVRTQLYNGYGDLVARLYKKA